MTDTDTDTEKTNQEDELELFAEKTFRLIVRVPNIERDAVENAVRETVDEIQFDDVDVTQFSSDATHAEFEGRFEGNDIEGGVSKDVNGTTVLTLRGIVYVDTAAEFIDELNDLLRIGRLDEVTQRLRDYDADENPLERVL
ncbi:MAG: hypothetical protein SXQ77_00790 [Halobacteria archaeon]|nr:hypothetical protein [Halobacteria archaeon]